MRRVWEVLHPYPEVVEGRVTEDSFVVTVGGIWERLELGQRVEVDPRYLDPEGFYRRTHFTEAMKEILRNIVRRLNGETHVQSIYHLMVGMGGGKSHTLLLLYYLVRYGGKVMPFLRAEGILEADSEALHRARVVVIDGTRIQPYFGIRYPDGSLVRTPWGFLLKQLGVYEDFKALDNWREIPTVPLLRDALSRAPTLILMDELTFFMDMLRSDETQINRMQQFLQALTAAVSETKGCALVVTTPVGIYEEAARLLASILDRYSRPMILASGGEYKQIRKRAIFQDELRRLQEEASSLAADYRAYYATHLPGYAAKAEEAILENYPFHPFVDGTVLKLKSSRAFQEVRDELRLLAGLVYSVYKSRSQDAYMISLGDADLADQYVRAGTIAKLQNPILVSRLDNDLRRIDEMLEPSIREAAKRILATIVLNSLAAESHLQLGVTEDEVLYALLNPDASPAILKRALSDCGRKLWFLNLMDGRWVFGSPNFTKLLDDYLRKVERDRSLRGRWWDIIRKELDEWKAFAHKAYLKAAREKKERPLFPAEGNVYLWPGRSEEIPDDRSIKLILLDYYLPLSRVVPQEYLSEEEKATGIVTRTASSKEEAVKAAKDFYESYGKSPRAYKNTVFFLVAEAGLVEKDGPVKYAKQILALEEMLKDRDQLQPLVGDLGIKHLEMIREDSKKDFIPSCLTVYRYLLYPSKDGLTAMELGEERRDLPGFLSMIEGKLRTQAQKVLDRIDADALLTRYWPMGKARPEVRDVIEGFYRRPELELVQEPEAIEAALREALREGRLVYSYGLDLFYRREPPRLEENGILLKDFEIVPITFEAIEEGSLRALEVNLFLDERFIHRTPYTHEDLRNSVHTIHVEIPGDMEFLGWDDGVKDAKRSLTWDAKRSLRILLRSKGPPPPQPEVELVLDAFDVSKNESLHVGIWIDDVQYRTPYRAKVDKDSAHTVRIERPSDLDFLGWSDLEGSPERKIVCDIDTRLVAKFKPIQGLEIWEGRAELRESYELFKKVLDRQTNLVRLDIEMDYPSFARHSGSLGMLLRGSYQVTMVASGGSKFGLENFSLQASGRGDRLGIMRGSLIQLRDYLEKVRVTLNAQLPDYKMLGEVVSKEALEALRAAEGILSYRVQLKGAAVKAEQPRPKRTLEALVEAIREEA